MNLILIIILFISPLTQTTVEATFPTESDIKSMLKKVNNIRENGCFCDESYMPSTGPLIWNETLYKSALGHAKEMSRYNYFAHYSVDGKDIGDRLDRYGYNWQIAGENLGEGQKSFDEVLRDWLQSKSHCKMLMNPKIREMGVARHGRFWVQHFGKQIPRDYKKVGRK